MSNPESVVPGGSRNEVRKIGPDADLGRGAISEGDCLRVNYLFEEVLEGFGTKLAGQ